MKLEEFKIDYNFHINDFKEIEDIEKDYFPERNISKAEEVMKWYEKNNLTCVGVRNSENKIVASVTILPLNKTIYYDVYNDIMNEADIIESQIEKYQNDNSYYLYLSSISVRKEYLNNYRLVSKLLKGCIDLFDLLKCRNIKISNVMADASTIHGEKICKKLLKMEYVRETSHNSKIYVIDGDKFIELMKRLKRFYK